MYGVVGCFVKKGCVLVELCQCLWDQAANEYRRGGERKGQRRSSVRGPGGEEVKEAAMWEYKPKSAMYSA